MTEGTTKEALFFAYFPYRH